MSLPKYAEYKDSGLDWIGMVPAHWRAPVALGAISSLKGRLGWQGLKADEYRDDGPYVVSSAHFSEFKIRWDECPRVSEERYEADSNIQLAEQDILLMKDGAAMGKLAFVAELPGKACLNSHLLLFRPLSDDGARPAYVPKFAFYYMQTGLFQEHIKVNGTGATFLGISQDAISRYRVVWPDLAEQRGVVAFLDRETTKIDTLIAEQEELIALLAEKRQATISHAVTRGLNSDAPMKDSGVAWLGEVPTHWRVCAVRRVLRRIEQGWSPECLSRPAEWNEWGVLKTGCVNGGTFTSSENKALPDTLEPDPSVEVRDGDLLMSRASGSPALVGSVAHVSKPPPRLMLSDKIFRLHLKQAVLPQFFALAFGTRYVRSQIEQAISGAEGLANNLPQSSLKDLKIAVPPEDEQAELVAFLEAEVPRLNALAYEAERGVALLKERRSALIAAAVTGQIDVRGQIALESEEEEALAA